MGNNPCQPRLNRAPIHVVLTGRRLRGRVTGRQKWEQSQRGTGGVGMQMCGIATLVVPGAMALVGEFIETPTPVVLLMPCQPIERGGDGPLCCFRATVAPQ